MGNNVLFACGSIHQGARCFSAESRGKQYIFISLAGLICQHAEIPENMWKSQIVDRIVEQGDAI